MEKASKFIAEVLPGMKEAFGLEVYKAPSISTNMPSDNMGFWITQGLPFGLFLLHIFTTIIGGRTLGRCFVNIDGDSELTLSQEAYVTEFCLDQAKNTNCGTHWPNNCSHSEYFCTRDVNVAASKRGGGNYIEPMHIPCLWAYRYHLWFLFLFIIARALPNITWRLFCGADIRKGIHGVATLAEFQHAIRGVTLAEKMYKKSATTDLEDSNPNHQTDIPNWWSNWMKHMKEIGLKEVMDRATGKLLYRLYVLRKVADIIIDIVLFSALLLLILYHDEFPLSTFVCDLHNDTNNLLQCSTIQQRYVPCTVSFGTEFIICVHAMMIAYVLDCIVQITALLSFTKIAQQLRRTLQNNNDQLEGNEQEPMFLDLFLFRELELDRNDFRREYRALMHSPNELYLVGMLYKQSNITHGHFLQMMSEKILEHQYVFEHLMKDIRDRAKQGSAPVAMNVGGPLDVAGGGITGDVDLMSFPSSSPQMSDSGQHSSPVTSAERERGE